MYSRLLLAKRPPIRYPEEKYYYTHPKEIQDEMLNAIRILRQAAIVEFFSSRPLPIMTCQDAQELALKRMMKIKIRPVIQMAFGFLHPAAKYPEVLHHLNNLFILFGGNLPA